MKKTEKSPWIGCLTYIMLTGPAFFLTSWQVATSIAVLITALMFMYSGIVHEIKKMKKLKNTKRTMMGNMPRFGYIKLTGRVQPLSDEITTVLTNEPADYRWISFQYSFTNEKREADGTTRYESGWTSFYDNETNLKTLEIFDSTGSCYVGIHNAHYHINFKKIELKATEFLQFIKDKGLKNIPIDHLEKDQKIRIVERWINKGQEVSFYGNINKLPLDNIPTDLIKAANKALKYGPDDDTRKRDPKRILDESDWHELMKSAKDHGDTTLNILTSDYTNTAENELVLNTKDNSALNTNSYIAIGAYIFGVIILILAWYGFVNSEYPEFFEQFK